MQDYFLCNIAFKLGSTTNPVLNLWNMRTISLKYAISIVLHPNATSCQLHLIMFNPKFSINFWLVTSQNYILLSDHLTSINSGSPLVAKHSICLFRNQSYKTVLRNSHPIQFPMLMIQHYILKVSFCAHLNRYSVANIQKCLLWE